MNEISPDEFICKLLPEMENSRESPSASVTSTEPTTLEFSSIPNL